jgi:hypothetical protein
LNQPLFALILVVMTELAACAGAAAFTMGFGAPIEERMGSDYGAEYYYRNSRGMDAGMPRTSKHCHTKTIKTEKGVRRVRRCR